ncbi:MAG: sulfatase [Waddliaceae bacterium]|nr:sulfatase [Waddliaceae bacterium]
MIHTLLMRIASVALAVLSFAALTQPEAAAAPRPNIIVFLVDDYDKPETSAYGGKVLTPNLDRLAREGMRFDNAFVTSTVCTPSRYTFLTGRCASSSYSHEFTELFPRGTQTSPGFNVALEEDNMNVGAVLAKNGYATGFVGKYHVGGDEKDKERLKKLGLHDVPKGVAYSEEINRKQNENEKRHRELVKERGFTWAKHIYWSNTKTPFQMHNPEWTIEAAVEFIEQHKDQPFYLHYATTLLHGPNRSWHKSLEHPRVTGEGMVDRDPAFATRKTVMQRIQKAGLSEDEAGYLWMDDTLGMILDKLDELKIADNTVVLFIADHGSNNKGSLQKFRGAEVPCLMRWPAGMKAGVVCDQLIQNTDFVPTWFELADAKLPKGYHHDGVSLRPLFKSPQEAVRDHVYCEMGAARAVMTKDYGYIALRYTQDQLAGIRAGEKRTIKSVLGLSGGVSRSWDKHPDAISADQLYDLRKDPEAQDNLAGSPKHRATLRDMRAKLTASLKQFPDRPYGEFVPGGNAASAEGTGDVFRRLRNIVMDYKGARKRPKRSRKSESPDGPSRKPRREQRKIDSKKN